MKYVSPEFRIASIAVLGLVLGSVTETNSVKWAVLLRALFLLLLRIYKKRHDVRKVVV